MTVLICLFAANWFNLRVKLWDTTSYKLEVTSHLNQAEVKDISIEEVMKKVKNGGSTEDILSDLEHIKNGKTNVVVDSKMIIEEFVDSYEYAKYALTKDGQTSEPCKWYDYNEEMAEFSKKYPNWLFTLSGTGEEAGDIWKRYYLNGKVQEAVARITFDDFDEKKLKKLKKVKK